MAATEEIIPKKMMEQMEIDIGLATGVAENHGKEKKEPFTSIDGKAAKRNLTKEITNGSNHK